MFFTNGSLVTIDYDLEALRHLSGVLDIQIDALTAEASLLSDPDGSGVFDQMESIAGLGFVACQTYLAATYSQVRLAKNRALTFGPTHFSGISIVALLNHAANFWKHRDEWSLQNNNITARNCMIETFDRIGCSVTSDYLLVNCMFELSGTNEESWRDALRMAQSDAPLER